MTQTRRPTHPAAFFKETIMRERNISIADAAVWLDLSLADMLDFLNEDIKCDQVLAEKLAYAVGTSIDIWLNMQAKLDFWTEQTATYLGD
jgi:addiction module HigA family antidote